MRRLRRMLDCRSGATALEFAIVSLFLVLISIGVIDFGRGLYLRNEISYAADKGARTILLDNATSDSAVEEAIRQAFAGPEPDRLQVLFGSETVNGVTYRTVTIEYPLELKIPGFTDTAITLSVARRVPHA